MRGWIWETPGDLPLWRSEKNGIQHDSTIKKMEKRPTEPCSSWRPLQPFKGDDFKGELK